MADVRAQSSWVDLTDPDSSAIAAALPPALHPVAIERLLTAPRHDDEPRARLEAHDDYIFGVLVVPCLDVATGDVQMQEVDTILTRDRLVTVRKTPPGGEPVALDDVRTAALADGHVPAMCLYEVIDEVAERYLTLVDAFDDAVDELEDAVESWPAGRLRERLSQLRHGILRARRAIAPMRDATRAVLDDRLELTSGPDLFPREVEIHFADAYDKFLRATDGLDLSRDLLAGVRDYHQAQVANDQNEVMKRLTVVASILLLPTLIVGLYGQNLKDIPEYHWRFGYLWSWGLIVTTTIIQVIYFRRKRWI